MILEIEQSILLKLENVITQNNSTYRL